MDTSSRDWFFIGVVVGAAGAGVVGCLLAIFSSLQQLYEWQTLEAGILALVAAIATIFWIQFQIDQVRAQELERRERQHYAARATMPAALAALVEYAEDGLGALRTIPLPPAGSSLIRVPADWAPPVLPDVPSDSVSVLRNCIESAEYQPRQAIAKLLAHLQISDSRLRGLFKDEFVSNSRDVVTEHDIHTYLGDFIELHLRCDRMIRYARGEQSEIEDPVSIGSMTTRAITRNFEHYPGLTEALTHRYRKND